MESTDMLIESVSPYGFDQTIDRISEAIIAMEWKMPAVHDLQQSLRNAGKDVLPVKVFEICNPKFSGRILELDAERIVSTLMPCRISVYERPDGKTYISRLNAGIMAKSFGGIIEEVMQGATEEVEQIIVHAARIDK
jgi:uncharacterized protein (DUF302 family)